MKMRSKEKIILITALAGIVGLGVWSLYSWLYIGPEKAIERELAKIRARGEPVTLEELAPPEIPDAENAALIYEQAFSLYHTAGRDEEVKLGEIAGKDLTTWTEEDIRAIREDLEKNQDCLRLIHQAANYDKCRFPLDYSQGYMMWLPHLSKMRAQARLLARDALLKAREGKTDEALESSRAGLRIGNAFLDEPILVSQSVRFAIYETVFSALEKILSESDAEPEILRSLLKELDIEEGRPVFTRCLKDERCYQIDLFESLIKDPARAWQMAPTWARAAPEHLLGGKSPQMKLRLARPIFTRGEIFALGVMREVIGLSKLPYHDSKADFDKLGKDIQDAPFYCFFTEWRFPDFADTHLKVARHEARIGLTQLALALKIYKAEKDKYPDTLAELVPHILPELPQDPFTGKDFVYKREGEGFLVYSLNENETDEGGLHPSDIPWRCKR